MEQKIKCKVQIIDTKEGIPVFFKVDGDRFRYPYTVKLLSCSEFSVKASFNRLDEPIQCIRIDGTIIKHKIISEINDMITEVEFPWYTYQKKVVPNKRRTIHLVELLFETFAIDFELQVKYYASRSTHLKWGRPLDHVLLESKNNQHDDDRKRYKFLAHNY
ncbi:hypothetical protein RDWZM_008983 [Blomia tropicalis]|uniref:Uncharacterized protein n=1 Tax=Blomia tropicalis TaxID=40697 RepID=A0A9Q0RLX6_BLOTA|nr:CB1 cannabinoid receptor-interacting protein 1 [Blomia tropicalis]KAJ6217826.1 hypothetical protein RDWZM_008983 [Blomia tropicalis]